MIEYTKSSHVIVSGGQTGADQAGLEAASSLGFTTGGWAPKNWETMQGPQKELLESYGLKEHSGGYRERTIQNVKDSDITIIISRRWGSPGTILTINACVRAKKPFIALEEDGRKRQDGLILPIRILPRRKNFNDGIDDQDRTSYQTEMEFYAQILKGHPIINCAGNAEENAPGITEKSFNLFYDLFRRMYD